jgi:hypothetical protein
MMKDLPCENYSVFCDQLSALLESRELNLENDRTDRYIEALIAWLKDTHGGRGFFVESNKPYLLWEDLIVLLRAAAIYE